MSRAARRAKQINEMVPIIQVLADYGYRIHAGGEYQEQQFSCDLHGSGRDNKPSARAYPASNSWFCFACSKSRDVVETIRAKENLDFMDSLAFAESKYNLPSVPWEDDDAYHNDDQTTRSLRQILDPAATFGSEHKKFISAMSSITENRLLPMDIVLSFWEASDKVSYQVTNKTIDDRTAIVLSTTLYDRLIGFLNGESK